MAFKFKALFMEGPSKLKLKEIKLPEKIEKGKVLVKVKVAGICGSDVECYLGHSKEGRYDIGPYIPTRIPINRITIIPPTTEPVLTIKIVPIIALLVITATSDKSISPISKIGVNPKTRRPKKATCLKMLVKFATDINPGVKIESSKNTPIAKAIMDILYIPRPLPFLSTMLISTAPLPTLSLILT
ncbi:unnamed protein product [marine sediment metagenome]|uniref:Uncharacterized protein n=1 Tax=marine sediment metagenome TaxID=412755 RepID=X1GCH7_9ZZZZ